MYRSTNTSRRSTSWRVKGYKKSEVWGQRYEDQDRSENLTIRHLNSIQNLGLKFFQPATTNRCLRLVQDQIPKQVRDDNERDDWEVMTGMIALVISKTSQFVMLVSAWRQAYRKHHIPWQRSVNLKNTTFRHLNLIQNLGLKFFQPQHRTRIFDWFKSRSRN